MEYYEVFIKVLNKEINKFNLDSKVLYSTYVTHLTASLAESFDVPYYRCAYLYRYGTGSIYFFNDCIKIFLLEYSNTKDIFSLWKSYSEVKVCSLSVGPGLDYLGFLLAILEYDTSPPNFNGVKIVSKHGAWRNTVKLMLEVFREQGTAFKVAWPNLKFENVDVIQADILKSYSGIGKILVTEAVNEANVILMMKTLNLQDVGTPQEEPLLHMLKELICSLKSEAVIFCIDTKPSTALLIEALSHFPGKFLYGPIHETDRLPANFPIIRGCHPVISMRGTFFVWQKLSMSAHLNLCTPPLSNISVSTENEDNLTAASSCDDISNSSTEENEVQKIPLNITRAAMLEDINAIPVSSQNQMQDLSVDSLKNVLYNCSNLQNSLHDGNSSESVDNLSPSGTLNSVSSFTCENDSSSVVNEGRGTGAIPKSNETLHSYHALVKNNSGEDTVTKVNSEKIWSCENKVIQTDIYQDIPAGSSSVKALTERIRQLEISLESLSQQNVPCNYDSGDSNEPCNHQTKGLHNSIHRNNGGTANKTSCLKQLPSCGFKNQNSLLSYESEATKKNSIQNMDCNYSCQCCHNRCNRHCCSRSCDFQSYCAPQPAPSNFSCNKQQRRENNVENVTSPTIMIPVQHIRDNVLLQIISLLKSESKI